MLATVEVVFFSSFFFFFFFPDDKQTPWEVVASSLSLRHKTERRDRRHHAHRVGVADAAPPARDAHHVIAVRNHAELQALLDAELDAPVDVLLPVLDAEVWLGFGEDERVDAAVEMGVLIGKGYMSVKSPPMTKVQFREEKEKKNIRERSWDHA